MKSSPIVAAQIDFSGEAPRAPQFDDVYHARAGALEQAEHVFLRGNSLPARWAGRRRFVVLETGFGLGNNFLATWAMWRSDPRGCQHLHYIAVDKHPPSREDLQRAHEGTPLPEAAEQLVAAWPPLTHDIHRLSFEGGRLELLLAFGDATQWLRELQAEVDAFFLDGFAPVHNPQMWSQDLFNTLPSLCAPNATAATWSVAREVRDGLQQAGFQVDRVPGFADKREMTVARYQPRHRPAPVARRLVAVPEAQRVIVVGAGLAGAATAAALAEQGLDVTVMDAARRVATGASGNPGGLFRSIVNRDDGPHARWHRASALEAERSYRSLLKSGAVPGAISGVLRLDEDIEAMRAACASLGLPPDHVRAIDPAEASRLSAVKVAQPAWHFVGGGWIDPSALVKHWLDVADARFHGGRRVSVLQRMGEQWNLIGAAGELLARAPVVVLANGVKVSGLVGHAMWSISAWRGQITTVPSQTPGLLRPRLPLASNGYALTMPNGDVLCGATNAQDDADAALRAGDHLQNLRSLVRLTGSIPPADLRRLGGRVGWRANTSDRLPLIGPVPAGAGPLGLNKPKDHARLIGRAPGLFVLAGLGSRGITSAPLAGRIVAAMITGSPVPVGSSLMDAVDAARFLARAARKRGE